jgi:hypothetical protein
MKCRQNFAPSDFLQPLLLRYSLLLPQNFNCQTHPAPRPTIPHDHCLPRRLSPDSFSRAAIAARGQLSAHFGCAAQNPHSIRLYLFRTATVAECPLLWADSVSLFRPT